MTTIKDQQLMEMDNIEEHKKNLRIAKLVYKELEDLTNKWQSMKDIEIHCCWDSCIFVNGEYFSYSEVREKLDDEEAKEAKEYVPIAKKGCECEGCNRVRSGPVNNAKVLF
jgi:hypothetical protein